eukprot:TRINITY_DN575_c0_g1_i1.p1 TRINITY_DN575_c0_g1~~TRINITY_DN575_c0_g1_i1.p1  ORF type:complete len:236 (+),score=41.43 TRINITY_DN575_c0_g1_i1:71-709(+)
MEVFFVPGNHDLWMLKEETQMFKTSLDKLAAIEKICEQKEVNYRAKCFDREKLWIVPFHSWYESSLDIEDDHEQFPIGGWGDFRYCFWPKELQSDESRTTHFLSLNKDTIEKVKKDKDTHSIITFSHFLPRRDCLPKRERLFVKYLPKVCGTFRLDEQIREIGSKIHLFGHTHIEWDKTVDGVRYVQRSLRYPSERKSWAGISDIEEMCIWP